MSEATTDRDIVSDLGTVGRAFFGQFSTLREVQRRAIPPIHAGGNVLVTSATASGKTEAVIAPLVARTRDRAPSSHARIRMLLIAPTRALVNDLAERLKVPLKRLGLTCGRQTSDHRDKSRQPFVLITTPESFDSMLVRDARKADGAVVDHLLAGVLSVFVDEAHLFDGSARGDQLCWLLARLRRLKRMNVDQLPDESSRLQVCAASATVSTPDSLAGRMLGANAIALHVAGTREIDVFLSPDWIPLDSVENVVSLRDHLGLTPSRAIAECAAARLRQVMASTDKTVRKALVFVPSRRLCDILSTHLHGALSRHRDMRVLAHHGSLVRRVREEAEQAFAAERDAVLVATTTLEVGVDIGDVDLVVLVGAPPGTRSLLQRIGRSGRRIGRTRVLALARTLIEQAAMTSMLLSARDGNLEPQGYARRWSVLVQQAASFVAQGGGRGRRRADLRALALDVWPGDDETEDAVVDALIANERLAEERDRLLLDGAWADRFDAGGTGMHANIGALGSGTPVVDASTGETIAHVAALGEGQVVALAGQRWRTRQVDGEILLTPEGTADVHDAFYYTSRRGPVGVEYAVHVRRGLGLGEFDAPVIESGEESTWFHFGGSAYQFLLCELLCLDALGSLAGLAVRGSPESGTLAGLAASDEVVLREAVETRFERLEHLLDPGPYQRDLPEPCRRRVVAELFDVPRFRQWLTTRRVWMLARDDPRWNQLHAIRTDQDA